MSLPQSGAPRLITDLAESNLKGAAYDLRMARDGMVLPDGTVIKPDSGSLHEQAILLEPGQTMLTSTVEKLNLPGDLVGNISVKGALANQGVLALTGFIVDPRYSEGGSGDGRLHFRLANLGRRPVLLQPGETAIASIQFTKTTGTSTYGPGHSFDSIWSNTQQLQAGLGFLDDLRDLEARVRRIEEEQHSQRQVVSLVSTAVMFVVAVTLVAGVITAFLTLGSNSGFVSAARNVFPRTTSDKALGVVALFGVAAIAYALVSALRPRQRGHTPDTESMRYERDEALLELRLERVRRLSVAGGVAAILGVAGAALADETGIAWWVVAIVALLVFCGLLVRCWSQVWTPLPRWRIDERVRDWEADALRRASSESN